MRCLTTKKEGGEDYLIFAVDPEERGYAHFVMRKRAPRGEAGRPGLESRQFESRAVGFSRALGKNRT